MPVVKLVDPHLRKRVKLRADDIHILPGKIEFQVLFRIDGALVPIRTLGAALLIPW